MTAILAPELLLMTKNSMNPLLKTLQAYPFERLRTLLAGITPPAKELIDFSIGEPRHPAPAIVSEAIIEHLHGLAEYPKVLGDLRLRQAITDWATQRFALPADFLDPERHVIPANGSREALFSIAQAVLPPCQTPKPLVLLPNPFYQIYEGAALLAGAEPYYLNCAASGQPDFAAVNESVWARTALLYVNSPHNPTGATLSLETLGWLVAKARQHGFLLAADECYSELYPEGQAPAGILEAAAATGSLAQVLAFHSLSKRSSIPGARSGFVAGDADILKAFVRYRTYLGAATPPFIQAAAIAAWQDEQHVKHTRTDYARKFAAAHDILGAVLPVETPAGGFYLWPQVGDGETFVRALYEAEHVRCLPGAYLARDAHGIHPGQDRVRIALVGSLEDCVEGLQRIRHFLDSHPISTL
ncbi:succinyldiaminopimelate transaminase [Acidithiobacillus ferrivorans]|jgi:N-succinyldiaminopimelate aminotransferase|uniref:succinyldiaminopimelate transaminase n=1 Tax=Acidithiobacillus ferrivorans TaxID=160808 RepID=UPI0003131D2D|nr:succinyldiaminopimelate transaminase [Acidithiobacillus ferrivorans]